MASKVRKAPGKVPAVGFNSISDGVVGRVIRRVRDRSGLSVRSLASKCGFSPSFISQVELGQASPSIASLERIASALGVTMGEFFANGVTLEPFIVKASDRQVVRSQWSRAKIEMLQPISMVSDIDVFLITLEPEGTSGTHQHTSSEDVLAIVFQGDLFLTLHDKVYQLGKGDTANIPAGTPHRWQNLNKKPAQLLKIAKRLRATGQG